MQRISAANTPINKIVAFLTYMSLTEDEPHANANSGQLSESKLPAHPRLPLFSDKNMAQFHVEGYS